MSFSRSWMPQLLTMNIAKLPLVLLALAFAALARGDTPKSADLAAFEEMKSLVGDWEATVPTEVQSAHFELIADNSVLASRLSGDMRHDMHTMFHMDQSRLMLTHYCAMHNQPRMVLVPGEEPRKLVFRFKDGTNIAPGDGHMNQAVFIFDKPDHHIEEWTYLAK